MVLSLQSLSGTIKVQGLAHGLIDDHVSQIIGIGAKSMMWTDVREHGVGFDSLRDAAGIVMFICAIKRSRVIYPLNPLT